jgi:radical SAM protein with 4Fe4S-binding SPASM domain
MKNKVPITDTLKALLNPRLNSERMLFTRPLTKPEKGDKVYSLTSEDIDKIRALRGSVVDLHPGMGGVTPDKLLRMIKQGIKVTSLDYMITRGCNFECTWCFASSGPDKDEYLPFDKLKDITEEAFDLGVMLFILTGGEPLIYKDPKLGRQKRRAEHFFKVVKMIYDIYNKRGKKSKIMTFDDVALITPEIAEQFAEYEVSLCTKGDTLIEELQDYKANQTGAFKKMQDGYRNLINVGYGKNPSLRLVVNSVLDHTTFDGMLDLHMWVMERGFDHSIVPVHYCGAAEGEDQEVGITSLHVKVLYDLISKIDKNKFNIDWAPWSAFTYNKTCNRNRSGLHIRSNGDVTACSESPGKDVTEDYTFGNIYENDFSLKKLADSEKLINYRTEFAKGYGTYVCSPDVCDLYENDLCQGGCATRSAYSRVDYDTGLIVKNDELNNYSEQREDPLCPAWASLAIKQGILRKGLLESVQERIAKHSNKYDVNKLLND